MFKFPDLLKFDIDKPVDDFINWIQSFTGLWEALRNIILNIFDAVYFLFDIVPWFIYIILLFFAGWKLYSLKAGIVLSLLLFLIGAFGLWDLMIYTLVIIFISVLISLIIGIPLGILMAKSSPVEKILKPILDGMQTMPSFVYLIPAVIILAHGTAPAIFATIIYAIPPVIRLTCLGIENVDKEVKEAGLSFGSTPRQMLFKIEIPQALSTIMTGVNQTTMMAVAMVVISSMIGAEGIGQIVLESVDTLKVGEGFQAGFAIVFLAIILDRVLQGSAAKFEKAEELDG